MAIIQRATFLLVLLVSIHADSNVWNSFEDVQQTLCAQSWYALFAPQCKTTTTLATSTTSTTTLSTLATSAEFNIGVTPATAIVADPSVTTSFTPLEQAHWCQFENGSFIPLNYSFKYSACAVCQCLQNRRIRCTNLPCMTTYCVDNSAPVVRTDQCCAQCASDNSSKTCVYNTVTIPHGK